MAGRPQRRARIAAEAARKGSEARVHKVEGGYRLAPSRASQAASWAALVILLMVWVPCAALAWATRRGIDFLGERMDLPHWTLTLTDRGGKVEA